MLLQEISSRAMLYDLYPSWELEFKAKGFGMCLEIVHFIKDISFP